MIASSLVSMATGLGKTIVMGYFARNWQQGRVMMIAHRDELIRQGADKIAKIIGEPCDIEMADSVHYCSNCRKYFNADRSALAPPGSHYTHGVIDLAVRLDDFPRLHRGR